MVKSTDIISGALKSRIWKQPELERARLRNQTGSKVGPVRLRKLIRSRVGPRQVRNQIGSGPDWFRLKPQQAQRKIELWFEAEQICKDSRENKAQDHEAVQCYATELFYFRKH
ncbi:hypothetical protein E5288_WYG010267 [Bos mutus]|uniref:Uncharacterized protein n=1 Tax=Bos mutus TaxID=72004 RepID=A0A6B0R9M2_9CETA|nr:hypothetical protein [Bos mutus]